MTRSGLVLAASALMAAGMSIPLAVSPAGAATIPVACDEAALIAAIETANATAGADTIELATACHYDFTEAYVDDPGADNLSHWYGPSALPAIASDITIDGNGATINRAVPNDDEAAADPEVFVPEGPDFRLFFIGADPADEDTWQYTSPGAGQLTLRDVTLSGGHAEGGDSMNGGGGAGLGGAIYNQGELIIEGSTLVDNLADGGDAAQVIQRGFGAHHGGGIASDPINSRAGGFDDAASSTGSHGGASGAPGTSAGAGGGGGFRVGDDAVGENGGGPQTGLSASGRGGDVPTVPDATITGIGGRAGNGSGGGGGRPNTGEPISSGGAFGAGGRIDSNLWVSGGGGGVGGGGAGGRQLAGGGGFGGGGGAGIEVPSAGGFGGFGGGGGASIAAEPDGGGGFGGGDPFNDYGGPGAGMGGAIFNHQGEVTIHNSTLTDNTARGGNLLPRITATGANGDGLGGAIFNLNGTVGLDSTTLAGNVADEGGSVYNLGLMGDDTGDPAGHEYVAEVSVQNSILAGGASEVVSNALATTPGPAWDQQPNTVAGTGDTVVDLSGTNLVASYSTAGSGEVEGSPSTADPQLGALGDNGGPTQTHAITSASPAFDAGSTDLTTDQRGEVRPSGAAPDVGAFELDVVTADLSVSLSDSPDPVTAGGQVTYEMTVENHGPDEASGALVTVTLPPGVTYVDGDSTAGCSGNDTTVTCLFGTVSEGSPESAHVVVTTAATATGTLSASATVASQVADPVVGNNSATTTTTVSGVSQEEADLEVALGDGPDPVMVGDEVTYTVTVTNHGPDQSTGTEAVLTLPGGVTFVSSADCSASGSTVTCDFGSIADDASGSAEVVVETTAVGEPLASVTAAGDVDDPEAANNMATTTTTVNGPAQAQADLEVTLADAPDPVMVGDQVTYTVTVTNHGPDESTGTEAVLTLPAGVTFVSSADCSASGSTVTCDFGSIADDASESADVVVEMTEVGDAEASVTTSGAVGDPEASNNIATTTTTVNDATPSSADLVAGLDANPDPATVGEPVTLSASVTNDGPDAASGVEGVLDVGAVGYTLDTGATSPACTEVDDDTISCDFGSIASGGTSNLIVVLIPDEEGEMTVALAVDSSIDDPATGNNTTEATITIEAPDSGDPPGGDDDGSSDNDDDSPGSADGDDDGILPDTGARSLGALYAGLSLFLAGTIIIGTTRRRVASPVPPKHLRS